MITVYRFDLSGKKLSQQTLLNGNRLDITSWERGQYWLLAIGTEGKTYRAGVFKD